MRKLEDAYIKIGFKQKEKNLPKTNIRNIINQKQSSLEGKSFRLVLKVNKAVNVEGTKYAIKICSPVKLINFLPNNLELYFKDLNSKFPGDKIQESIHSFTEKVNFRNILLSEFSKKYLYDFSHESFPFLYINKISKKCNFIQLYNNDYSFSED